LSLNASEALAGGTGLDSVRFLVALPEELFELLVDDSF
jgi:hypothetical protein